ncbi:endonuclease domain-containing protein [Streptomyces sp. 16-176A]|uniref:endonuclease domain-containing protein n=1 Tax=Streptomyces sp. 16-176A TaxID=2530458 RepID=UPI00345CAD4A
MKHKALCELADGGVLLTSRALAAGWPRRSLTRELRTQGWTRLYVGAWVAPGHVPDFTARLRAVQSLRPRLVVSHRSAAALWGIELLRRFPRTPLELIDPGRGVRQNDAGTRVYRMHLDPNDVVRSRDFRFTAVRRTLTDLLLTGPRDEAIVAVDSALADRKIGGLHRPALTDLAALTAAFEARVQGPRSLRGAVRASGWLDLCDPQSGSPAETIARLRLYDAGLRPESQVRLVTATGRRVRLDFLFREAGLAVEIEGYAYHGTREAHREDIDRFNQILQCPEVRSLLRFTAETVLYRPEAMLREIRAALGVLAASGGELGGGGGRGE